MGCSLAPMPGLGGRGGGLLQVSLGGQGGGDVWAPLGGQGRERLSEARDCFVMLFVMES